jgi:hypothetical protein
MSKIKLVAPYPFPPTNTKIMSIVKLRGNILTVPPLVGRYEAKVLRLGFGAFTNTSTNTSLDLMWAPTCEKRELSVMLAAEGEWKYRPKAFIAFFELNSNWRQLATLKH